MTAIPEGLGVPDAGPPGGLVHVLKRWEGSAGRWRVLNQADGWVTVGLSACGEDKVMSTVTAPRTSVLEAFLAGRFASDE